MPQMFMPLVLASFSPVKSTMTTSPMIFQRPMHSLLYSYTRRNEHFHVVCKEDGSTEIKTQDAHAHISDEKTEIRRETLDAIIQERKTLEQRVRELRTQLKQLEESTSPSAQEIPPELAQSALAELLGCLLWPALFALGVYAVSNGFGSPADTDDSLLSPVVQKTLYGR